MEGPTRDSIKFTTNAKKVGFETVVPLVTSGTFVAARALDVNGKVLATTNVWDAEIGATVSDSVSDVLPWLANADLIFFSLHSGPVELSGSARSAAACSTRPTG